MTLTSHPIKNIRYSQFFFYKFSGIAVVPLVSSVKKQAFFTQEANSAVTKADSKLLGA
jgi:hypothetical protein